MVKCAMLNIAYFQIYISGETANEKNNMKAVSSAVGSDNDFVPVQRCDLWQTHRCPGIRASEAAVEFLIKMNDSYGDGWSGCGIGVYEGKPL